MPILYHQFNIFGTRKIEKVDFEIPIIPQNLNFNNWRITSSKTINLDIIRKFIEYSLKNGLVKTMFTRTVFPNIAV